jgi:hypothetical protein
MSPSKRVHKVYGHLLFMIRLAWPEYTMQSEGKKLFIIVLHYLYTRDKYVKVYE